MQHSMHLQASSISELEVYVRFRGLSTAGDIEVLRQEGYIDDAGNLTKKADKYLEAVAESDKKRAKEKRT